jgi:hypothetical protein
MIVVPVFMISCHVSEKPNIGPLAAQTIITARQTANASGFPAAWATTVAHIVKSLLTAFA